MATVVTRGGSNAVCRYEPMVSRTFLPRCSKCEAPHPLARRPVAPDGVCPDCGTKTRRGPTQTQRGQITDPIAAFGVFLANTGAWLRNLANRD